MVKSIKVPSNKEVWMVACCMTLFLLMTGMFIGLRSEHLLMAFIYLMLFFAGLPARKFAVALLPFVILVFRMIGCVYVPITK